ncbi:hypothetical protein CDD83_8481 [Cordyceps sp. RAO-2017]|nr:hypothetical protein CDD83_8481 [Cordyceps sp. RAO-2017]
MLRDLYGDPSKSAPAARRPAPAARPPLPASLKSNDHLSNQVSMALKSAKVDLGVLKLGINQNRPAAEKKEPEPDPFHLHVYSHKHNTHITFTRPNRNPIVSLSCGNIGFRKSRRGTFDAAYSLTKYALEKVSDAKLKIESLELVLKGFGQGREAAVKVLLGPEGKALRDKIIRVADATKIKFGGTRSEKPRRL